MTFAIEPDEFIQILHDGGSHWVMISTIGTKHPEVRMYDSLYCSLPSALKHQIAALLATKEKCSQVVTTVEYLQLHLPQLCAVATHLASSSFIRGPCDATSFIALRGGSLQCSPSTEVDEMKTESNQRRPLLYSAHGECLSFLELK